MSSGFFISARYMETPALAEMWKAPPAAGCCGTNALSIPFCSICDRRAAAFAVYDHRELIAAETGQKIVFAQILLEPPSHGLQEFVARRVAQGLVDVLEAVEIEIEHGEVMGTVSCLCKRAGKTLHKGRAVGQAGQQVRVRQPHRLDFRDFAAVNVYEKAFQSRRALTLSANGKDVVLDPNVSPGGVAQPEFAGDFLSFADRLCDASHDAWPVLGMEQLREVGRGGEKLAHGVAVALRVPGHVSYPVGRGLAEPEEDRRAVFENAAGVGDLFEVPRMRDRGADHFGKRPERIELDLGPNVTGPGAFDFHASPSLAIHEDGNGNKRVRTVGAENEADPVHFFARKA